MRRSTFAAILLLTAFGAASTALAATPAAKPAKPARAPRFKGDPWEPLNRRGYAINGSLDKAVIRPLALLSGQLTPGPIGKGLRNAVTNLSEPVVAFNDLAQLRVGKATQSLGRLVVNSTLGLLGTVDVAGHNGVKHHDNTFGDTLGRYGVGPGPYLFLPLLGPSDVRDLFGIVVDGAVDPLTWARFPYHTDLAIGRLVIGGLAMRAGADSDLQTLLQDAADPYATLRSTYLQSRQGEIEGSRALPALPDIDSSPGPEDAPPSADAPPTDAPPTDAVPPTDAAPTEAAPPTDAPPPPRPSLIGIRPMIGAPVPSAVCGDPRSSVAPHAVCQAIDTRGAPRARSTINASTSVAPTRG